MPLLEKLHEWASKENISLSLPSMRVDGFSDDILSKLKSVRKSGLTFAPEAGSQRMRDVINKNVTEEELISTCSVAFEGGYSTVKLYFMIGLPTETMDDVADIAHLAQKVVDTYYACENRTKGRAVKVTVSASAFVPKPFTPFQWFGQDTIECMHKKQWHINDTITSRKINYNYHDADTSFLEAVFARGDRRLSKALLCAFERGVCFDSWDECFSLSKWLDVFSSCGIDPAFYANRQRSFDEVLPWDHLDYGIDKEFLVSECQKAYENITTQNCREKCAGCGAAKFKGGVCYEKR